MNVLTPTLAYSRNLAYVFHALRAKSVGSVEIGDAWKSVTAYEGDASITGTAIVVDSTPTPLSDRYSLQAPAVDLRPETAAVFLPGDFRWQVKTVVVVVTKDLERTEVLSEITMRHFASVKGDLALLDANGLAVKPGDDEYDASYGVSYFVEQTESLDQNRSEEDDYLVCRTEAVHVLRENRKPHS